MRIRTSVALFAALLWPLAVVAGPKGIPYRRGEEGLGIMAEARLAMGRIPQAIELARQCLEANPDAHRCTSVIARGRAAGGHCEDALPLFATLRATATDEWNERTALMEGLCHLRGGELALARACFEEGVELKPRKPLPLFQRAMLDLRMYDTSHVEDDVEALLDMKDAGSMPDIVEAWSWLQAGSDAVDGFLASVDPPSLRKSDPPLFAQYTLVDCMRWMDVGDPWAAAEVARIGLKLTQGQTRLVACQGEALRRQGEAHEAWYLVDRPWHRESDSMALDAVAARALIDLGMMDEARARAAEVPRGTEEGIGTAWYLARADGDAAAMAALERDWERVVLHPRRRLEDLVPFVEER